MNTQQKNVATSVEVDDWEDAAFSAICEYANEHAGEEHVAEGIRAFAENKGVPPPHDKRAWGPLITKAETMGVISKAGYAPTKASNGSPKRNWLMVGNE
jgi:hypothetical protein